MMSMIEWLARMCDRLEQAGIDQGEVAIAITELQERQLLEEVRASGGVYARSAHHSEFMGWRIIVKGKQ